ncbi:hypothetical protein CPHO_06980 [Corynebacterium phocae]|uniref:Uncharacterized protein n=1 Tax=Corynebacterium phocae TaxID=161895 RepID=A0A1L7D3H9_9CORY|nr:hypothetical protein [Corynebacterium phocae]APT92678.1 hypothetical protein CPHO_06980 [Corynebacterium phocae]KAA8723567.1 hypothetical protein F4V58_06495 [Corynebacterium phocae]
MKAKEIAAAFNRKFPDFIEPLTAENFLLQGPGEDENLAEGWGVETPFADTRTYLDHHRQVAGLLRGVGSMAGDMGGVRIFPPARIHSKMDRERKELLARDLDIEQVRTGLLAAQEEITRAQEVVDSRRAEFHQQIRDAVTGGITKAEVIRTTGLSRTYIDRIVTNATP